MAQVGQDCPRMPPVFTAQVPGLLVYYHTQLLQFCFESATQLCLQKNTSTQYGDMRLGLPYWMVWK